MSSIKPPREVMAATLGVIDADHRDTVNVVVGHRSGHDGDRDVWRNGDDPVAHDIAD
jgi:hypothetical protein